MKKIITYIINVHVKQDMYTYKTEFKKLMIIFHIDYYDFKDMDKKSDFVMKTKIYV